jgi:hypothetical protein
MSTTCFPLANCAHRGYALKVGGRRQTALDLFVERFLLLGLVPLSSRIVPEVHTVAYNTVWDLLAYHRSKGNGDQTL